MLVEFRHHGSSGLSCALSVQPQARTLQCSKALASSASSFCPANPQLESKHGPVHRCKQTREAQHLQLVKVLRRCVNALLGHNLEKGIWHRKNQETVHITEAVWQARLKANMP